MQVEKDDVLKVSSICLQIVTLAYTLQVSYILFRYLADAFWYFLKMAKGGVLPVLFEAKIIGFRAIC